MIRWLLALGLFLSLVGYFAPWVAHSVLGLAVTGLDLGEYVKFLPLYRSATLAIWREGFYAPLVAISAAGSFAAYRQDFGYRWLARIILLVVAIVAALNLLPPAWTPTRLLEAEFRLQLVSMTILLVFVAFSPFLALIPHTIAAAFISFLAIVAIVFPIQGFFTMLPSITGLYHHSITIGFGIWLMAFGLLLVMMGYWWRTGALRRNDTVTIPK